MGRRVLIRSQTSRMTPTAMVLCLEVYWKDPSCTLPSRWVMAPPPFSGITNGAMEFFSGTVFLHSMPLERLGMRISDYFEHHLFSII